MARGLLFWLGLTTWSGVEALLLQQRDVPAILSFPIQRLGNNAGQPQKRASMVSLPFEIQDSEYPTYTCNMTLGTPPQEIQFQLDTGSGYLTVAASNSSFCTNVEVQKDGVCLGSASFNVSASSTCKFIDHNFNMTYYWDEYEYTSTGDFATDTLTIDEVTLPNMQLGIDYGFGFQHVLGLGYVVGEDSNSYTNLPQALVNGGWISSAAYSLWMDDPSGNTGTLLLGGVNTAKYTGELHTMSIPAVNGVHYLPVALVTSIAVQTNSSVSTNHLSGLPVYMILDTRMSFIYLPDSIVEGIYEDLGAWWDGYFQYGRLNCSMAQYDYNVTFTFTDFDINIPLRDLIFAGDDVTCTLSIAPSGGDAAVLGNTFLSSVYVVYDLSNNEISMAETNFNPGEDSILEIGNGTNPVPGAVSVSTTTSATIPTTFTKPPYISVFPPTPTVSAVAASSSTPATNSAVLFPQSNLHNLIAGLISTCLLFAL